MVGEFLNPCGNTVQQYWSVALVSGPAIQRQITVKPACLLGCRKRHPSGLELKTICYLQAPWSIKYMGWAL